MPNTPKMSKANTLKRFDMPSMPAKDSTPKMPTTPPTPKMSARDTQKPKRKEMTLFGKKPSPRKKSYLDDIQTYEKNMANPSRPIFVAEPNSKGMREHKESLKAANSQVADQARKCCGKGKEGSC